MINEESIAPKRRGRPSVVDRDAIADAAFHLWSDRGFSRTGWRELSEATGVSARTLLRHYGTRDRIAWAAVEAATDRLNAAIATLDKSVPADDALRRVIIASLPDESVSYNSVADWLRLIVNEPEIAGTGSAANRIWTTRLTDFLIEQMPEAPPFVCGAIARACAELVFGALAAWAEGAVGAGPSPADAVSAALERMTLRPDG